MKQLQAQLEGLAIGLEQRGEKSAAHCVRLNLVEIERLTAENAKLRDRIGIAMARIALLLDEQPTPEEWNNAIKLGQEFLNERS